MSTEHNFGPACRGENVVFGAQRPGYDGKNVSSDEVKEWIRFMRDRSIGRVVCLLPESQLAYYRKDLLDTHREVVASDKVLLHVYQKEFGSDNVRHAPIEDFHLSTAKNLESVLEFLSESERLEKKTVVHCSGGSGRTGHVLAAWLVRARDLEPCAAIRAVEQAKPPRNPREAVRCGNATEDELIGLLHHVRPARD